MIKSKNITYAGLALLVAYSYGVVTAQYKIFPYEIISEIKQIIISDTNAIAAKKNNKLSQQTNYKVKRKSFLEEHVREAKIIMLGDSLTDHAKWTDLFPSQDISNHGINGDTTADILDRIELIYKAEPEKVFIMIGINDIRKKNKFDVIQSNYKIIVNRLIEKNIKVYIQSTLLAGQKLHNLNEKVISLNNILEKFASTSELITYIHLNEAFGSDSYLSDEYSYDGLGLNGKGYAIWRDAINPYIM